jgi:hypothetical protein
MGKKLKSGAMGHIEGTEIRLGTGVAFRIGAPISPKWEDLYYVIQSLYNRGYLKNICPPGMTEDLVITSGQNQIEYMVAGFLRAIDAGFDTGKYTPEKDYALLACAYVLAWYWHIRLGGPRPYFNSSTHYHSRPKIYQDIPELRCPFCTKIWKPDPKFVRTQVIAKLYHAWLGKHYKEYHKWGTEEK